jgi:ribosomal protein S12 methylthiotransferase accessory factor
MLSRPRFNPALSVHLIPPQRVVLIGERRSFHLDGRAYYHLAPLLNGEHTTESLLMRLDGVVPMSEVLYALSTLEQKGHIVEASMRPDAEGAFWSVAGVNAAQAADRSVTTRVRIRPVSSDATTADALADAARDTESALRELGWSVGAAAERLDLDVVVTDDYLRADLDSINRDALVSGRPWLLAKPVGVVMWLGPLVHPGETACWQCLAQRVRGNRHVETYLEQRSGQAGPLPTSRPAVASTRGVAAHLVALEAAKWRAGAPSPLRGSLRTIDLLTWESREHVVVRRPQCPACGDGNWRDRPVRPLVFQSRGKTPGDDGGFRTVSAEDTYARLVHHVSPITGVVSSLEPLLGQVGELAWSYSAGHNFAMMTDNLFFLRQNLRGRSGGKGTTAMQAKVGGLCEAIERYSGVWRGEEPVRRAAQNDLGSDAVGPIQLMQFSRAQYTNRSSWNAKQSHTRFHIVPEPYDPSLPIDWSPAWSIVERRTVWVPSAFCYFGHPDIRAQFVCLADANGTAAGNTIEEATLQGLLEVIERDAVALWWYNRIPREGVDLDSFDLPYVRALQEYHARLDREIWVLDITSDTGIPVFVGVSRRTDRPVEDLIIGFGAHLDPRLALLRALTEVNQFLPAILKRNPDGSTKYWFHDSDAINWWQTATTANQPYVAADPRRSARRLADYPQLWTDDLKDDVERTVATLASLGHQTLVMDQTRPDVEFSVAKVIVPGLRHFWRRLGPGRLYDVPVRMGWLDTPTPEEALNPISIFF